MYSPLLKPDLQEMLLSQDTHGLAEFCDVLHPGVAAEVLEGFDDADVLTILDASPLQKQVEVFEYIPLAKQMSIVETLDRTDRKRLSRLLEEMSSDDRVDLMSRLQQEQIEHLLPLIAQAERNDIRKLLSYPDYSAGSIMSTEYASLPENITVAEALTRLRNQAPDRETIYYIYILDAERRLLGFVSLRALILASPNARLADIMTRDLISVRVDDDQEDVAATMQKFNFIAIPVVDEQHRLVGIVTHDDAMDVLEEEATEDAHLLGAVAPLDDSYLETPIRIILQKRSVWLALLSIAAVITAATLKQLDYISDVYGWMILFLPLVLASGGNAGSQSATLVIRHLALTESTKGIAWKIVSREILIGLSLGTLLAAIGFSFGCIFVGVYEAAVIGITVAMVVTMGTVLGSTLPLLFLRLGMDPALMSNPLIAALSDLLGVLIYFMFALLFLGGPQG